MAWTSPPTRWRQLALSALTTEQFNLQTARMGTIAEANGRSTLYLGTLSSAVIAIAFVGQADELGDAFYLFALLLLPPVFLLGTSAACGWCRPRSRTWSTPGTFRIRQYFLGLDPAAALLPADRPVGMTRLERIGVVATGPLQLLLTAASMVACINAIVGGVAVGLASRALAGARSRRRWWPARWWRWGWPGSASATRCGACRAAAVVPSLPGAGPGPAGMGAARWTRRQLIAAHRPRRSSSSRTRAKRRAARAGRAQRRAGIGQCLHQGPEPGPRPRARGRGRRGRRRPGRPGSRMMSATSR